MHKGISHEEEEEEDWTQSEEVADCHFCPAASVSASAAADHSSL